MNWEILSNSLSSTECLGHSEKNCLGAEVMRQKMAEQEKKSMSGTSKDNGIMGKRSSIGTSLEAMKS